MNGEPVTTGPDREVGSAFRKHGDLFLISLLVLFLELACIRWFPPHVLYLTFFTNTVLLACFLGMSLGCLAVKQPRRYMAGTPYLLGLALATGLMVEREYPRLIRVVSVKAAGGV